MWIEPLDTGPLLDISVQNYGPHLTLYSLEQLCKTPTPTQIFSDSKCTSNEGRIGGFERIQACLL